MTSSRALHQPATLIADNSLSVEQVSQWLYSVSLIINTMWLKCASFLIVIVSLVSANQRREFVKVPESSDSKFRVVRSVEPLEDTHCSDLEEVCYADDHGGCGGSGRKSRHTQFPEGSVLSPESGELEPPKFVETSRNERSSQMVPEQLGENFKFVPPSPDTNPDDQQALDSLKAVIPESLPGLPQQDNVAGNQPPQVDNDKIMQLIKLLQEQKIPNLDQNPIFDPKLFDPSTLAKIQEMNLNPVASGNFNPSQLGNFPTFNTQAEHIPNVPNFPDMATQFQSPSDFIQPISNGMQFNPSHIPMPEELLGQLGAAGLNPKLSGSEDSPIFSISSFPQQNLPSLPIEISKQFQISNDGKPVLDKSITLGDVDTGTPHCHYCDFLKNQKMVKEPMTPQAFMNMMQTMPSLNRPSRQAEKFISNSKFKRDSDASYTKEEDCPNGDDDQSEMEESQVKMHPSLEDHNMTNQASKESTSSIDRLIVKVMNFDQDNESSLNKQPKEVPQTTLPSERISFSVQRSSESKDETINHPSSSSDTPEPLLASTMTVVGIPVSTLTDSPAVEETSTPSLKDPARAEDVQENPPLFASASM